MSARIAVVASHPVQYQAPFFRRLADRADLTVLFCQRHDPAQESAAGYGHEFSWDVPLTDGYPHVWLENVAARPGVGHFRGCDTPEIAERITHGRFDACIVQGWYLKSYVQAIAACRRRGVPVLLRGDSQLGTRRALVTRAMKYVPYRVLLNSVAGHLVVGSANRAYLAHYGVSPSRLFDVPHAVDDQWFADEARAARARGDCELERAALGIPSDARVAIFVGRLVDMKRPLDFIRAVADPALPSHVWGLIVGSGPLEDEARALVATLGARVRFAGFRNQRALPAMYAAANVLVLPSDARETWGLVANEALASGLPIVVSKAAGCAPDLAIGDAGRSYPVGNVAALASAMGSILNAVDTRPKEVALAVRSLSDAFGCEAAVSGALRAVEVVIGRRQSKASARLTAPSVHR